MKRVIISICILSAMIGLGIFFNIKVSSECKKLIGLVELAQQSMDSGNTEEAIKYITEKVETTTETKYRATTIIYLNILLSRNYNIYDGSKNIIVDKL